jgi:hypothetical protein
MQFSAVTSLVSLSSPANLTLLVSSYQHAYANVYSEPMDVFDPNFATDINSLLPSKTWDQ